MKILFKLSILSCIPFLFACSPSLVNEHPVKHTTGEDVPLSEDEIKEILSKEYKVMFIGNSFTYYNDIDKITESIGKDLGMKITCEKVAVGSHHLYEHAQSDDETGKIIEQKLQTNSYTHVILQEHSTYPVSNYTKFLEGATQLKQKINQYQPKADIRLYETWGFQSMADSYTTSKSIPDAEQLLFEKYRECANELSLKVHYVGKGFTKAYQEYKNINLYNAEDSKHPSYMGTYLASLIHIASLTGLDVRTCNYNGNANEENATVLKSVAYETVKKYGVNP